MGKIIAIGGGELRNNETLLLDQYIVNLTNKKHPKALFIPTASHEPESYIELFQKVYGELGCLTDTLYLINHSILEEEIKQKILSSDLIYVGGGDTKFMLELWKEKKVDIYLKQAYEQNIVLAGLSAGSICWFQYGHSDSLMISGQGKQFIILEGLGFIQGLNCPHFNDEIRENDFTEKMKKLNLVGIAIEDHCALEISNDTYKVIKCNEKAKIYKFQNTDGIVKKEEISNVDSYFPLSELYK